MFWVERSRKEQYISNIGLAKKYSHSQENKTANGSILFVGVALAATIKL